MPSPPMSTSWAAANDARVPGQGNLTRRWCRSRILFARFYGVGIIMIAKGRLPHAVDDTQRDAGPYPIEDPSSVRRARARRESWIWLAIAAPIQIET